MLYFVDRNIEQWPAIEKFAKDQDDKLAQKIYAVMQKPSTICYFYLLQHVLSFLIELNKFFQRAEVVITDVAMEIEKTFKNVLSCVINKDYLVKTPASEIRVMSAECADEYLPFIVF